MSPTKITSADVVAKPRERFGVEPVADSVLVTVEVPVEGWHALGRVVRDELAFLYFNWLSAIDWKDRRTPSPTSRRSVELGIPPVACTITWKTSVSFAVAAASSELGTSACVRSRLAPRPAAGSASTMDDARMRAAFALPPRPQRTLWRVVRRLSDGGGMVWATRPQLVPVDRRAGRTRARPPKGVPRRKSLVPGMRISQIRGRNRCEPTRYGYPHPGTPGSRIPGSGLRGDPVQVAVDSLHRQRAAQKGCG